MPLPVAFTIITCAGVTWTKKNDGHVIRRVGISYSSLYRYAYRARIMHDYEFLKDKINIRQYIFGFLYNQNILHVWYNFIILKIFKFNVGLQEKVTCYIKAILLQPI